MKKISIIIPCFNEEKGVGKVIDGVAKDKLVDLGYEPEIIVIDNNSKDKTSQVAKRHGATVYFEKTQGKVAAMKKGFKEATGDIFVTIDGDNTYPSHEIPSLIRAFDGSDLVIGSRFNSIWNIAGLFKPQELPFSRVIANKIGAELGSIILGHRITDVTTGLRAFRSDLLNRIPPIKAKNLDFEAELTARVISNGLTYKEVRISSNAREGHSSLNYFRDAFRFLWAMIVGKYDLDLKPLNQIFPIKLSISNIYRSGIKVKTFGTRRNSKLKIVIVADRVYPFFKGGAEKRSWELSKRLTKNGCEVHYFTGQWPGMKKDIIVGGIHIHGIYTVNKFYVNGSKSILESVKFSFKLLPALLRSDFDVIDCDQFPVLSIFPSRIAAWIRGKKLFVTWHEVWSLKYWYRYIGIKGVLGFVIDRVSMVLPDEIISASVFTEKRLNKILPFRKNIVTVASGVDVQAINHIIPSKIKSDIFYCGRLIKHKHLDVLLQSVALVKNKFPSVKCLIVGNGPEKESLVNLAKNLDLKKNVSFHKFYQNDTTVYSLMKSSKMFVLPSTREGFGIVVIEANACGIPVLTINHLDNAAKNLITKGLGHITNLDFTEISQEIMEVISQKSNRSKSVALNRQVSQYDWEILQEKIKAIYVNGHKHVKLVPALQR